MFVSKLSVILIFVQIILSESQIYYPDHLHHTNFAINQINRRRPKVIIDNNNDESDESLYTIDGQIRTNLAPTSNTLLSSLPSCYQYYEYKRDNAGYYVGIITIHEPGISSEKITNAVFSVAAHVPNVREFLLKFFF